MALQPLSLLEVCSTMDELEQIHASMYKRGLVSEPIPLSRLLAFCSSPKSGDIKYAQKLFNKASSRNTFMWNAMIRGYSHSTEPEQALLLYSEMIRNSVPHNTHTLPFLLRACSKLPSSEGTMQIHARVVKMGFGSDVFAINTLLHAYAAFDRMEIACLLFDQAPRRDIVSWNTMIDGYAKCGEVGIAFKLFKEMPERTVVSWTTMISGFVKVGMNKEALKLFRDMLIAGVKPDNVALLSSLSACAHLGAVDQGRWIHTYIDRNQIRIDPELDCALIDMYGKCGHMEEALGVFTKSKNKCVSIWTAAISGFAIHGQAREAMDFYMQMQKAGIKPNSITLTAILTACSHSGLVHEGKSIFKSITSVHSLNPTIEHYGCLVDLLGRAGLLKEAKEVIETMPIKPNAAIWGALLNVCKKHANVKLGKLIGKKLIEVDPGHGGRYIHAASIFAESGEWDEAVRIRRMMKEKGIRKFPGCSSITINGSVHEFFAGDGKHPQLKEIHQMWRQIVERLELEGYRPEVGNSLLYLEDEEKEVAIHQHSEKLAIAFGLISTKPGTIIQVFKNLRICEDCHVVTKMISKIYSREIVMRDRSRFHLFRDGICTCGDFW
ncbi:pentatricopeptide repeat-containing protein At5g66520-like [Rhodamnia argentea]|uniref:Pentatricopeptide repeat-containing protein At5g66520-like n=1 Tax=Rhodamnia argentea TaxID=178133 RepID=A0ABM3H359_9MYRT|nr:pentatricopeptide repeat-containing protein At5g66520-like [Rhodamnia argentea]